MWKLWSCLSIKSNPWVDSVAVRMVGILAPVGIVVLQDIVSVAVTEVAVVQNILSVVAAIAVLLGTHVVAAVAVPRRVLLLLFLFFLLKGRLYEH